MSRAFRATKREIFVSVCILAVFSIFFSILLWLAERNYADYSFGDAMLWPLIKYIDDPAEIGVVPPVTVFGKIVGSLVGVLGIAIFAVPAGLIGSGLIGAMEEEKREKELIDFRKRVAKSFRRTFNRSLRTYLESLPDKGGYNLNDLNIVPLHCTISKMQVRQSMDIKDVMDVCHKFQEFRLKNLAQAIPAEEEPADRLVVEQFPINTEYGCCINRGSKVTIFSTSSFAELGIGWFTYYLAKFGGFNYISKDFEVDPDEFDSYFNVEDFPLCDKKDIEEWKQMKEEKVKIEGKAFNALTSVDEAISVIEKKENSRKALFEDIKKLLNKDGSWLITMNTIDKTNENPNDFVFTDMTRDGKQSSVIDEEAYQTLYNKFSCILEKELELKSAIRPKRYPLTKKNIAFFLRKERKDKDGNSIDPVITNDFSSFALRISSRLINLDLRKLVVAYLMAITISEQLDDNRGMRDYDKKDFETTGFGYQILEEKIAE